MTIFTRRKNSTTTLSKDGSTPEKLTQKTSPKKSSAGNIFFALFAAVAMVGAVGYGFNTVIKGPISGMSDVTRRTVAENSVITASRVAIVNATTQQDNGGDCDADGMIEPLPYRDAGANPRPAGGGYLPTGLVPDTIDPWNSEYGYCAWDAGSLSIADAVPGCGGAGAKRLQGSPENNQYAIAIISAGKDRRFQTNCNDYVDTTPADSLPDTPLLVKADGSDDIVLGYTYAEANNLGNGMWKEKIADPTTIQTEKNVESTGGATFADKVVLTGNTTTGGGLVLPGDPGDDSLTGPCNGANDKQLRRNTGSSPPTLEICDDTGGLGWTPVSGSAAASGPADCTGLGDEHYNDATSGHCYFYDSTTLTHDAAQADCAANGGYLMVPTSTAENNIITDEFNHHWVWIGISDQAADGSWVYEHGELAGTQFWTGDFSGSPVGGLYNAWEGTEPNGGAGEACAVSSNYYSWYDIGCGGTTHYICEVDGTPSGGGGGGGGSTGSLVAHWKLDEAAGTTVTDSVGGFNGTLNNTATWVPTGGQNGGALSFTAGNNAYIRVPRDPALEPSAVTVSMWVKPEAAQSDWAGLLSKTWNNNSNPSHHSYGIFYHSSSDVQLDWFVSKSGGSNAQGSVGSIPALTWTHVAATYDPTAPPPQFNFYINGALDNSLSVTDSIVYDTTSTGDLYIGSTQAAAGEKFGGLIDDVRVYNYALTPTEIQSVIEATSPPAPALKAENVPGTLFGWGHDWSQAQGNGASTLDSVSPYALPGGDNFVQVSAGWNFGCGIKQDKTVWCWGFGNYNKTGDGGDTSNITVPTKVVGIESAVKVSAGGDHACALRPNGEAMCWGYGLAGALGTGTGTDSSTAVAVVGPKDFIDITTSHATSCGLTYSGAVYCWGAGSNGQLGNGINSNSDIPVQVSNITNFVQIDASPLNTANFRGHTCGVTKTGAAYCWGYENGGEFGNGATTGVQNVPTPVSTYSDFVKIETFYDTTCALRGNGTIYCFGDDTDGQLGNGATAGVQNTPSPVSNITDFTDVSVGFHMACGTRKNRELWCWGINDLGNLGTGPASTADEIVPVKSNLRNVVDFSMGERSHLATVDVNTTDAVVANKSLNLITAGREFACSVVKNNGAVCWGDDTNGELGNGAVTGTQAAPTGLSDAGPWMQLSASPYNSAGHVCGIKGDGSAWCWGAGASGQLGNGGTADQVSPVVVGATTRKWSQISVGFGFSCGLELDGQLYCWGTSYGNSPVSRFLLPWKKISAGRDNVCGILKDGSAWCWGSDTLGELGNGAAITGVQTNPIEVASPGPWVDISAGPVSCGIKSDGSAWCWGDLPSLHGSDFANWDKTAPQMVMDPGPWVKIKTNYRNVCGIKADGSLWCWGEGSDYVNGNNSTTDFSYPQRVIGGGNYIDISVGYDFACGMKSDYTTYCWGKNTLRQIGNPAITADATTPQRVNMTPQRAGWEWNSSETAVQPTTGLSPTIGTSRWISDDGAASKGLNLGTSGRSQIRQAVANQLFVETEGAGLDAQLSLSASGAKATTDITDGLAARWTFDNTVATTVNSPTLNATLFAAPTYKLATDGLAKVGSHALRFVRSSSQYARVNRDALIETPAISVGGWIRMEANPSSQNYFIGKAWNNDNAPTFQSYVLLTDATKLIGFGTGYTGGIHELASTSTLPLNQWVHVMGTYDPTGPAPQKKLYVNGVLEASATIASPILYDTTNNGRLYFSREGNTGVEYMNGLLDDMRIYNRALDPGEVAQIFYYTSQDMVTRSMGVDATSGNFEITRNNSADGWLSSLAPDLEVSTTGNVGIGTTGAPASKLDVNGAIRVGDEATCNGGAEGTIRWNSGQIQYCDGTWKALTSSNSGGGGGEWNSIYTFNGGVGLKTDGSANTWGDAWEGRLGNNQDSVDANNISVRVHTNSAPTGWTDWVQTAGTGTNCGLRSDGSAWCWGYGWEGQIGNGIDNRQMRPSQVRNTANSGTWSDWVWITSSDGASCGIRTSGTAYCWGYADQGGIGNGSWGGGGWYNTPQAVHSDTNPYTPWTDWKFIEGGGNPSVGIRANGEAYSWGNNIYGLGNTPSGGGGQSRPKIIKSTGGGAGWTDWKVISAGWVGLCGIRANGQMYCWGNGSSGQLGDAFWGYEDYPKRTYDTDCSSNSTNWIDVDTSGTHACAIKAGGTMWCWGRASEGQAGNNDAGGGGGDGNNGNNYCFQQVLNDAGGAGWSDWVSVFAVSNTTCGARANGTTWCWGEGASTAGGDAPLPVQVQ